MSGYSAGGVVPPAGDIGGTILLPRIRSIEAVLISLMGGAEGDVLTQQSDGSFAPQAGGGGGGINPPAGDIGGTAGAPIIESINSVLVTLGGGATGDVLTQQSDGSFEPAPGGGGGTGVWNLTAGADLQAVEAAQPFGVNFNGSAFVASGFLETQTMLTQNEPLIGGTHRQYTVTASGLWNVFGGQAVAFLPIIEAPAFSGPGTPPIQVQFALMAVALDESDAGIWTTNEIVLTTGESYQTQSTDFVNNPGVPLGDLSLVAFSVPFEGNGIVSSPGGVYFTATQCTVTVAPGTTFP